MAVWLVTYLALALAAVPAAAALFPRLADRGAAFALPLALAVVGVVGYLVGQVAFGWPALIAGLAVLVGSSYAAGEVEIDREAYAESMVVFSVAFLFVVALRAFSPAVTPIGGEKFLDFGLLKSLVRTAGAFGTLAPEDMWFAGEPVQYYYGGHMIAALLTTLTGTAPRFAYNLALAGFFGALATAAWGLAGNIGAVYGAPRRFAAGLGLFFTVAASNLHTAALVLLWLAPDGVAAGAVSAAGLDPELAQWAPKDFFYWPASRVIPGTINEFPLFSWLNGDLHAHMMSTPFTLLLAAVLFAYWRTPEADVDRRRLLVFGVVPPLAGLIAVVNTWSFPTAAGLTFLTLTFAPARPTTLLPDRARGFVPDVPRADGGVAAGADADPGAGAGPAGPAGDVELVDRLREEALRSGLGLGLAVGMLLVAGLWALPFWLGTASGRSVALFPGRSSLGGLVLVHGAFLVVFGAYLARRVGQVIRQTYLTALMVVLFAIAAWQFGFAAVALFGPLLVAGWALLRLRRDVGFETVLILAGLGLALIVEFAYVVERAGPERFNTVFKTYMQVWVLWAPAAGVALTRLLDAGRSSFDAPNAATWRRFGTVVAAVLVFMTALYGGFAVPAHFERGGPESLDATAFVAQSHPGEAGAIDYVDSLEGQPNMVSAAPASYFWQPSQGKGAAAAASLTGVPTVAGWSHEVGYRGQSTYQDRVADVRTIYTGDREAQLRLLEQYDVEYIYVGPAERNRYRSQGITIRSLLQHSAVSVAYTPDGSGEVTVLRVDQSKL